MRNPVGISMKKEEIVIRISEKATHDETVQCLLKKIPALKKLYKTEKTPICVTGKILKNREIEEIKKIITDEIDVKVTFDSPKVLGLHGIKKVFEKEVDTSEAKFYKGSLRSGQKIEFEGSLVILGDVNGGAEVIAGENIVVLGVLRGLAHSGAKGNKKAIIATHRIECPQIRIANVVKELEKQELDQEYKFAFIEKDKIIME
ncbi:MAG: septum site-determining protein MinC [Clostridia bacterium]|nr:septum site-determining protein MinC [Clostridia bacterium]